MATILYYGTIQLVSTEAGENCLDVARELHEAGLDVVGVYGTGAIRDDGSVSDDAWESR